MENIEVNNYIKSLDGDGKEWTTIFVNYMREKYPELEEVISFKIPTYKLKESSRRNYIAFGVAKNHFSLHTTDFEYITILKTKLKNGGKGKGCVNVKFTDIDEQKIIFNAIDEIYNRSSTI